MDHWVLYEPHDDSYLLEHCVKTHAKGTVLDMGTGSGIQAAAAAASSKVTAVVAADINPKAVAACKKLALPKTRCVKSDLFDKISGTFDTIIFNPPYLPQERDSPIIALEGGKHGHEVIERFLDEAGDHLAPDGQILLVFSSHSNTARIFEIITRNMLHRRLLASQKHFFEELYVYRLRKDRLRQALEKKGVKNIRYLARGHRGIVHIATLDKTRVAIKAKNPKSQARSRIANEAKHLKLLNKHGIGPQLIDRGQRYVIYNYVDGPAIRDWLPTAKRKPLLAALLDVLHQCRTLDELNITKEEMHRPHKHIIIERHTTANPRPVMIDFERCHLNTAAKNVTQFCQYLRNQSDNLKDRGIIIEPQEISRLARAYSKERTDTALQRIADYLKNGMKKKKKE